MRSYFYPSKKGGHNSIIYIIKYLYKAIFPFASVVSARKKTEIEITKFSSPLNEKYFLC